LSTPPPTPTSPRSQEVIDRASGMLRAGGDPERLRILELLLDAGELQVSAIAEFTGAEMSTTSQRLKMLLGERLVKRRRAGRSLFYRLADKHVESILRNVLDHADPAVSTDC